jgi:hypothetical protein
VPDEPFDRTLERLLAYPEATASGDAFVDGVMQRVRREQKTRSLILYVFGLIGAVFGVVGATLLSGKITWLFIEVMDGTLMMQVVLFVIAALAFYSWFMNDELTMEH